MDELMRLAAKLGPWAIVLIVLAVLALPQSIRILREYERGVIFRLG
jgi:regulator of protease activity HflC (stomatin/prohibitin superfamily)